MSKNLHTVFSLPPRGVSDEEYNAWYDAHLAELLVIPGFFAARRYRLHPSKLPAGPLIYPFVSVYEVADDLEQLMADLWAEDVQAPMQLPPWFKHIRFASWNCRALDDSAVPVLDDHLLFVFSKGPDQIDDAAYRAWYVEHLAENLEVDNYDAGWRFVPEPDVVDSLTPPIWTHLAIYQVSAPMEQLTANRAAFRAAGRATKPDWFSDITFASGEAIALGPRVSAPTIDGGTK